MEGAIIALGGRAIQLMKRVGLEADFALVGGMTHNAAMVAALEHKLGKPLQVPPSGLGQLNGAFGASLLGLRRVLRLLAEGRGIPAAGGSTSPQAHRWSTYVPATAFVPPFPVAALRPRGARGQSTRARSESEEEQANV
jgi:hypothetical protein